MSDRSVDVAATARLLDGRLVSLRPLTVTDAEAVLALHQHLSDHDRYFRFFTLQLSPLYELVAKLTEPEDGLYALGAFDADRLIGVAHYVVVDDPKVAEVAVVVAHEDHSVGVGTALLKHLAPIARSRGIGRFIADVLGENHLMLTVFFDLGWSCRPIDYGSIRHLEIELPQFDEASA
ncbi:GNAT family N-acetyltransferase [Mycobacterium nebraskense]|uniref:GNAT family N-acetyltransferase n=1 Tax=Mycobacterium nebraskense TaxID=244292 RepID=UPI00142D1D47|nr:GNAT family N-acetyltransferase [Mycobacterium nebraskense]MBI2695423.1 GNAT family N-acetyltransferase [Mycobacterium nebraskense]MCV7121403.1 GNAT family N-acetyltransferase [Mycobacterium nebraskense]